MAKDENKGAFPSFSRPLKGKRLTLAPLEREDLEAVASFFADTAALYYYLPDLLLPRSRAQLHAMMDEWNDGRRNFVFAFRHAGRTIGLVTLSDLDPAMGNAEAGVMIAGEEWRGKGFATEALELLLAYAFDELGLHRLYARVAVENTPSLKLFRRLGFLEEGRLREAMRRGGRFIDLVLFGLLEDEYRKSVGEGRD